MNREQILLLIYKYKFTATEAYFVKENFQNFIIDLEYSDEQILVLFDSVIEVQEDDFICFQLAELKNKILQFIEYNNYKNSVKIISEDELDEDFDEDFEDEQEENPVKWASKKEKERVKKLEEYLETNDEDYILKELSDFIFELYPDTYNEINRYYIGEGCRKFLKHIGTENTIYIDKKYFEKWKIVATAINKEVELRKYDNDKKNINLHKSEYIKWALTNSIKKHTKQNIKMFLKQYGTKLSENIIDEIKILAGS